MLCSLSLPVNLAAHFNSTFDVVLSNILEPFSISLTFELLAEIIRILKPGGKSTLIAKC